MAFLSFRRPIVALLDYLLSDPCLPLDVHCSLYLRSTSTASTFLNRANPGRNCTVVYDRKRRKTARNVCRIRSSYPTVGYVVLRLTTTNVNDQCIRTSHTTAVYDRYLNVSPSSNWDSRIKAYFSFLVSHHWFCFISDWFMVIWHATTCSGPTHARMLLALCAAARFSGGGHV